MDWRIGTIGFGYADWRNAFYPPGTKDALSFYARHYDTVEIDSTFHAIPPRERMERWTSLVPAAFRFLVKTPKAITHETGLGDAIAPMRSFIDVARGLGEKLAAIVIQYPPTLPGRVWPQVARFLDTLPTDVRYAVEFRQHDFFRDEIYDGLARRGIALVNAEYDRQPREPIATTDFTVARLIGIHERYDPTNHERVDRTADLAWWRDQLATLDGVRRTHVVIGNDYAGFATATADRLKGLVGQPVATPQERMGTLF